MAKIKDYTGEKFNRLTAVKFVERKGADYFWLFKCDCGTEKILRTRAVIAPTGEIKSCGCLLKEKAAQRCVLRSKTHGMRKTRFYGVWNAMKTRCENQKSEKYYLYGGRGIKVYWRNFQEFLEDMYESYVLHLEKYGRDTSLDRIDVDGDYCKENCRWATAKEQANNTQWHKKNGKNV